MLRRTPSTPLVCLVLFVSLAATNYAAAADPQESLEILLKPNSTAAGQAKARAARPAIAPRPMLPQPAPYAYPPVMGPITKVKALPQAYYAYTPPCILPRPMPGQWDMSFQVIIGRVKGQIGYPRVSPYWSGWWGWENIADLNDDLGVPAHGTMLQFTAKYQFRPSWGLRYTIIGDEFDGGTNPTRQFMFGTNWLAGGFLITPGLPINTQWQHQYQRIELVYDALKSCSGLLSISGGWVHTDDKISLNCQTCGFWTAIFSQGGDSAVVGLDFQRCIRTAPNGGTLSLDAKGAVIFLDNVEGWDVEAGLRFSVPLNCGRAGYMKAGYRLLQYKKSQTELYWSNSIEGGFVAAGFIF